MNDGKDNEVLSYEEWYKAFEKAEHGREALESLKDLEDYRDYSLFDQLRVSVTYNCYRAWCCSQLTPDRFEKERQKDVEALKEIRAQLDSIEVMRKFIREYPRAVEGAFFNTLLVLRNNKGVTLNIEKERFNCRTLLDVFLSAYADSLQAPISSVQTGSFVHRYQTGNLIYPKPIDNQDKKPDGLVNGLLLLLVYMFRRWTDKSVPDDDIRPPPSGWWNRLPPRLGQRMHPGGKPCYKQAALFTKATWNMSLSQEQAKGRIAKLIKKYPDIEIRAFSVEFPP